jgi:hypothetical protein
VATYLFETITEAQALRYGSAGCDLIFEGGRRLNAEPYTAPRLRDPSRKRLKAEKFKLKRRMKL